MPRPAADPLSPATLRDAIIGLLSEAERFLSPERALGLVRKWLRPSGAQHASGERMLVMATDASMLAADLTLSQPSSSGTNAFDRLAKTRRGSSQTEQAAVEALRQARFRVLRTESPGNARGLMVRDAITGEALRVIDEDLPALPPGTPLFARTALLGGGVCTLAGAVTPLDDLALKAALTFPGRQAAGAVAAARWAEAVYAHVCRHGTLDVPGLNRADPDGRDTPDFDPATVALIDLTTDWSELAGAEPDADLLQRTRAFSSPSAIIEALGAAALAERAPAPDVGPALERLLVVMLQTVQHRSDSGASPLGLDGIGAMLDHAIAAKDAPREARKTFEALRRRLAGAARPSGDAELERVLARIKALRAKTVDQGCTEQEALAAAEKVAELLDRYGLSLGELEWRAMPCEGIGIQTERRRFGAIDNCVPAIAAYFDCRVWVEQPKGQKLRYVFFGLRADVAAAEYLYNLVERAFETETQAFRAGPVYAAMASERRSATTSFQTGLAHGISRKLTDMRSAREAAQRSATGRDLVPIKTVVVEEELARLGLSLEERRAGGRKRVLTKAFDAGQAAGERFEVTPALARAA